MKTASAPLVALLNSSQQFTMADLYAFTLASGAVLCYTPWDTDLVYNGNTYASNGPLIARSQSRTVLGVEVETLDLVINPRSIDLLAGAPFLSATIAGALDGAYLRLDRVFMSGGSVVGGIINFTGGVSDIIASRTEIKMTVKSDMDLLNVLLPRILFQPGCAHALYDSDCGIVRASVVVNTTVATATTTSVNCSLSQAAGYFDMGYLQFTSGALAGLKRTVKAWIPGNALLLNPLPAAPSPGDGFAIYPGCDKMLQTCKNKFNNLSHFRGFPYIPQPETAV